MSDIATSEMDINLENEVSSKSISGKELSKDWPKILSPAEETKAYTELRHNGEGPSDPPQNAHIDRLSYELTSGSKRLRFFAVFHQHDIKNPSDPNMKQYEVLEHQFKASPPQLVLYEGFIDDTRYPITREQALTMGEPIWMMYLVQQHNANLKSGETPVAFESADVSVNDKPNEVRDSEIIKSTARKFGQYDKIDIVMGSGHAIRERQAWEEFFDKEVK